MTARHAIADWLTQLHINTKVVTVTAEVIDPVELSNPVCAVVRGLIGNRLRQLLCTGHTPCKSACDLPDTCGYAQIFETDADTVAGAHGADAVRPYWLAGLPVDTRLAPGECLTARLTLVGPAKIHAPYFHVALLDALKSLGRPQAVEVTESDATDGRIAAPSAPTSTVTVATRTPIVVKRGNAWNRCADECPAEPWVARLARLGVVRLRALESAYGGRADPIRLDWPSWHAIERTGSLERWRGSRFSHRQQQRMPTDGVRGHLTLTGPGAEELGRLFGSIAQVGIGKHTTMGFGSIEVGSSPISDN